MRPRKYHVALTGEERKALLELVKRGKTQGYKITRAQILLAPDENAHEKIGTRKEIAECYHRRVNGHSRGKTIYQWRD